MDLEKIKRVGQSGNVRYVAKSKYTSILEFYFLYFVDVVLAVFLETTFKPNQESFRFGLIPIIGFFLAPACYAKFTETNARDRGILIIYLKGVFLTPFVAWFGEFSYITIPYIIGIFDDPDDPSQFLSAINNISTRTVSFTGIYGT